MENVIDIFANHTNSDIVRNKVTLHKVKHVAAQGRHPVTSLNQSTAREAMDQSVR
jgi:hypothetical protein